MQAFPHHYQVTANATETGNVDLSSAGLTPISSAAPAEFGGPGDCWSPETLLIAAAADCFILTFRAIAGASKLSWSSVDCDVTGTLDRIDGVTKFTEFQVNVRLGITADESKDKAQRIAEKAEAGCLIANSLSGPSHLNVEISVQP